MSNYPPAGPPPPYGYPPQPAPGIAFVPAPVMMPIYPPQTPAGPANPTYITNHYHPNQPQMIQPVEVTVISRPSYTPLLRACRTINKCLTSTQTFIRSYTDIDWVTTTAAEAATYTHRAFVAGKEGWDGSPLWVIRAHHSGEFIPGKLAIKHRAAYVPHGGKEVPVHNFDVLLAKPHSVRWVASIDGQVPPGAIAAGNTHTGEPLYIGRVSHMNSITPGKVHPSHRCVYICFSGQELSFKQYEVLCRIVG